MVSSKASTVIPLVISLLLTLGGTVVVVGAVVVPVHSHVPSGMPEVLALYGGALEQN